MEDVTYRPPGGIGAGGTGRGGGVVMLHWPMLLLLVATLLWTPGAANVVGGRELCDEDCPRTWNPVCSTKQATYVNACFLYKSVMCIGLREVTEAYRGPCTPCVEDGTCPTYSDPVCGWDGHTYLNLCTFQLTNSCRGNSSSKFRHRGACAPDASSPACRSFRLCHVLFMPVCGSDERTYGNTCELDLVNDCRLEVDKVRVVRDGECPKYNHNTNEVPKSPCTDPSKFPGEPGCEVTQPVCGSDGRNYASWRKLQQYNDQRMPAFKVDMAYMGHCLPNPYNVDCKPVTDCPNIVQPVCATNGRTYINHCELFRTNECRQYNHWIHFLHDGSCRLDMGLSKAGPVLMKITIVLVVVVVFFAVIVPLYYARRSHQLVTSWNANYTTYSVPSSSGGRYHLVATVGTDMPMVSIIPIGVDAPFSQPVPAPLPSSPRSSSHQSLPHVVTEQCTTPPIDDSIEQSISQPLLPADETRNQRLPPDYNIAMLS